MSDFFFLNWHINKQNCGNCSDENMGLFREDHTTYPKENEAIGVLGNTTVGPLFTE